MNMHLRIRAITHDTPLREDTFMKMHRFALLIVAACVVRGGGLLAGCNSSSDSGDASKTGDTGTKMEDTTMEDKMAENKMEDETAEKKMEDTTGKKKME